MAESHERQDPVLSTVAWNRDVVDSRDAVAHRRHIFIFTGKELDAAERQEADRRRDLARHFLSAEKEVA